MELEINITKTCRKELFDFIVDKMKNGYQFIKNVDEGFFWETIKKPGSRVVHLQFKHYLDKDGDLVIICFYWRQRKSPMFRTQTLFMSKQFELPTFVEGE